MPRHRKTKFDTFHNLDKFLEPNRNKELQWAGRHFFDTVIQ